jgi:hypothetical protein
VSETISEQIESLKTSIAALEAQRSKLGETVVEAALIPLCDKLEESYQVLEVSEVNPPDQPKQQRKLVSI